MAAFREGRAPCDCLAFLERLSFVGGVPWGSSMFWHSWRQSTCAALKTDGWIKLVYRADQSRGEAMSFRICHCLANQLAGELLWQRLRRVGSRRKAEDIVLRDWVGLRLFKCDAGFVRLTRLHFQRLVSHSQLYINLSVSFQCQSCRIKTMTW